MKLISCHIENFGKLQNFDYSFDGEKSIIHEDNGWGKSTLATFIRVMFYGFMGENKRTITDNERKKYKPWQMGTYGGNIVFSANGKEYRMERRFGEKKSGADEFALYDNTTNLKSDDFATNIGEELFGIDIDSFMRTVFIAQQDCGTSVTPNISAKIGNVSDQTADMGNYDNVQSSLKREMDRLTPDRATGLLRKMEMKISELRERVRNKENYANNFSTLEKRLQEQVAQKEEKAKEQIEVQKKLEQVAAIKDSQAGAEKYKEICEQVNKAKGKYDEVRAFFPKDIPDKKDLEDEIRRCDEYEDSLLTVKNFTLSDEENKKLALYEESFSGGIPDENTVKKIEDDIESLSRLVAEKEANLLSEAESRKLDEAEKAFSNYKPSLEEIDNLTNKWSERKSKKEVLSTKRANAELIKTTNAANNSGASNGTLGILLIVIGIVAVLGGLIAIAIAKNMTIGVLIAVMGVILAIAGAVLFVNKNKKSSDGQDNSAYAQILDEIEKDEEFIFQVEELCKGLFDKLGVQYIEYDVPAELNRFRALIKDYDDLVDRKKQGESAEREDDINGLVDKISGFLHEYKFDADTSEFQKSLYQLKNDASDCIRIREKNETMQKAAEGASSISNKIKDFLRALGFEVEDDLKKQLSIIKEKYLSYEYLKDDLETSIKRKENFEKENDISKFTKNIDQSETVSLEELNESFNSLKDEIDRIGELEDEFRGQMDEVAQKLEEVESDEAELNNLEEDRERAMKKYNIVAKTRDYLEKAKQNFSSKYMDDIKASFEKYHNIISDDGVKYELDANLNIQLQEKGSLHEIDYLSEGYKDLVGLCRRMAMVDAMYDLEKPFLIFDDPFVNLDENRLDGAMKFMDTLAKDYQIVYFSCHQSRC